MTNVPDVSIGEAVKASWGDSVRLAIEELQARPGLPSGGAAGNTLRWNGSSWAPSPGLPSPAASQIGVVPSWNGSAWGVAANGSGATGGSTLPTVPAQGGLFLGTDGVAGQCSWKGIPATDVSHPSQVSQNAGGYSTTLAPSENAVRAALAGKMNTPGNGSAGQFLQSNGTGTPQWANVDSGGSKNRTWYRLSDPGSADLSVTTAYTQIGSNIGRPSWAGNSMLFMKCYTNLTASGVANDATQYRFRIRFGRAANADYTGYNDHGIAGNGNWLFAHTWQVEGGATDYYCHAERSSAWTATVSTRHWSCFFIEKSESALLAIRDGASPGELLAGADVPEDLIPEGWGAMGGFVGVDSIENADGMAGEWHKTAPGTLWTPAPPATILARNGDTALLTYQPEPLGLHLLIPQTVTVGGTRESTLGSGADPLEVLNDPEVLARFIANGDFIPAYAETPTQTPWAAYEYGVIPDSYVPGGDPDGLVRVRWTGSRFEQYTGSTAPVIERAFAA
jgi:hypothetical protein